MELHIIYSKYGRVYTSPTAPCVDTSGVSHEDSTRVVLPVCSEHSWNHTRNEHVIVSR